MSLTYVTAIIDCTCGATSTTYPCYGRDQKRMKTELAGEGKRGGSAAPGLTSRRQRPGAVSGAGVAVDDACQAATIRRSVFS